MHRLLHAAEILRRAKIDYLPQLHVYRRVHIRECDRFVYTHTKVCDMSHIRNSLCGSTKVDSHQVYSAHDECARVAPMTSSAFLTPVSHTLRSLVRGSLIRVPSLSRGVMDSYGLTSRFNREDRIFVDTEGVDRSIRRV